jgi:hypothetical protein
MKVSDSMKNNKSREEIRIKVKILRNMYFNGLLGGEVMPEDSNPKLPKNSPMNYLYFTLPMALNYQRNSYTLWVSALDTYLDPETNLVFDPNKIGNISHDQLKELLLKHKLGLQPIKHTSTWLTLSHTIAQFFDGDIRNLFVLCEWDIPKILNYVQVTNKKHFPYLSGPKICNYWLYVINNYTDAKLTGRESLSIAPDTHVIQATARLGLIDETQIHDNNIQNTVNNIWKDVLLGTELSLIDLHTPLWLWSRNGFKELVG